MSSRAKATIAAVTALTGILVLTQAPALARRGGDHNSNHPRPPACAPVGINNRIVQIKGQHGGRPSEPRQKGTIVLNFKKGLTSEELTANLTAQIYHALTEGRINQTRADELVAGLPALIADFLSRDTRPDDCRPPTTTTTPPDTTVPETTVPETTVPETTVPETTVPDTTTIP